VRALQGPTLHQGLLALNDVAKKLSTPGRSSVAPFRASQLTSFLSELLGGNAIVAAVGLLAAGEPDASR